MARKTISKKITDALHKEYEHRCAVCGGSSPHIHHIDEDSSNNELLNLLPLCPNCHLSDQHNPTRKVEIRKLQLFRKYKDPAILKPQFHPIYTRQLFLETVMLSEEPIDDIESQANELIEFIQSFEMGEFYGRRLNELIGPLHQVFVMSFNSVPDPAYEKQLRATSINYRQHIISNRESACKLIIELLRYQSWANADKIPN